MKKAADGGDINTLIHEGDLALAAGEKRTANPRGAAKVAKNDDVDMSRRKVTVPTRAHESQPVDHLQGIGKMSSSTIAKRTTWSSTTPHIGIHPGSSAITLRARQGR